MLNFLANNIIYKIILILVCFPIFSKSQCYKGLNTEINIKWKSPEKNVTTLNVAEYILCGEISSKTKKNIQTVLLCLNNHIIDSIKINCLKYTYIKKISLSYKKYDTLYLFANNGNGMQSSSAIYLKCENCETTTPIENEVLAQKDVIDTLKEKNNSNLADVKHDFVKTKVNENNTDFQKKTETKKKLIKPAIEDTSFWYKLYHGKLPTTTNNTIISSLIAIIVAIITGFFSILNIRRKNKNDSDKKNT
jgi:hypothetical protein